jgi:hypothetical protein
LASLASAMVIWTLRWMLRSEKPSDAFLITPAACENLAAVPTRSPLESSSPRPAARDARSSSLVSRPRSSPPLPCVCGVDLCKYAQSMLVIVRGSRPLALVSRA